MPLADARMSRDCFWVVPREVQWAPPSVVFATSYFQTPAPPVSVPVDHEARTGSLDPERAFFVAKPARGAPLPGAVRSIRRLAAAGAMAPGRPRRRPTRRCPP